MRRVSVALAVMILTLGTPPVANADAHTALQFSNASGEPVQAWLAFGPASAGKIENAALVDAATNKPVLVDGTGLMGTFTLQPGQTVNWDAFNGGVVAGGTITFGAPPQSCPVDNGPCGVTKGEFTVNNGNEAVDISSVDGINAIMSMDLTDGGPAPWPAGPGGTRVAQNSGTLTGDKSAWGVFPYRCTKCAAIGDAPATVCNPLGPASQSYCKEGTESDPEPVVCQLNRNPAGGTVKFAFHGFSKPV